MVFNKIKRLFCKSHTVEKVQTAKSQHHEANISSSIAGEIGSDVSGRKTSEDAVESPANTSPTDRAIASLDAELSRILNLVIHHEKYQVLEGSWRGLQWLVENSLLGPNLRVHVLDISKQELKADLARPDLEATDLHNKIYQDRIANLASNPFAVIVGDFEFSHSQQDVSALSSIGKIAERCFAPFVAAPSPRMFGIPVDRGWDMLEGMDDMAIENRFLNPAITEMDSWRKFRPQPEASFVVLTMPRVIARKPFGSCRISQPTKTFTYKEFPLKDDGFSCADDSKKYCWMSSAYCLAQNMADAFSFYGWGVAISGLESGGRVEELPKYHNHSGPENKPCLCSTEIPISIAKPAALASAGITVLVQELGQREFCGFLCAYSSHKIQLNDDPQPGFDVPNRIGELMAFTRAIHAIHRILLLSREKLSDCEALGKAVESWFNLNFVDDVPFSAETNQRPFEFATITPHLSEYSDAATTFNVILRPRFQMEALTYGFQVKI